MMTIRDGLYGLAIGDALGVPVEFCQRESLTGKPVTGMQGGGAHRQPAGTFSDDTSLALATADSLAGGLDYDDLMARFYSWYSQGCYAAGSVVFDIGNNTERALKRYAGGTAPLKCGGRGRDENGNGSLMRILPAAYQIERTGLQDKARFGFVHRLSALTHGHPLSLTACDLYIAVALRLFDNEQPAAAITQGFQQVSRYYEKEQPEFREWLKLFEAVKGPAFSQTPSSRIKSSGYVADTLIAALWCFTGTASYSECVLKAVNLGDDTDTVAAVAGGLAGIRYGFAGIPQAWFEGLRGKDIIETVCTRWDEAGNSGKGPERPGAFK